MKLFSRYVMELAAGWAIAITAIPATAQPVLRQGQACIVNVRSVGAFANPDDTHTFFFELKNAGPSACVNVFAVTEKTYVSPNLSLAAEPWSWFYVGADITRAPIGKVTKARCQGLISDDLTVCAFNDLQPGELITWIQTVRPGVRLAAADCKVFHLTVHADGYGDGVATSGSIGACEPSFVAAQTDVSAPPAEELPRLE
jgi:hypothetical protein